MTGLERFRQGESIEEWVERYFIERPMFDDGQPAQFGDCFIGEAGIGHIVSMEFGRSGYVVVRDTKGVRADAHGNPSEGWRLRRYDSDAQSAIDSDAAALADGRACAYWAGSDTASCSDCPHRSANGISKSCLRDGIMDLLKRQRELSAATGE